MSFLDKLMPKPALVMTENNPFASLQNFENFIMAEEAKATSADLLGEITLAMAPPVVAELAPIVVEQRITVPLESTPRTTLLNMIRTKKLDEEFTFFVRRNCGADYVHAMRAVLSRTRGKAIHAKQVLDPWKLLVVRIVQHPTHDEVALLRSKKIKKLSTTNTDELLAALGQVMK